MSHLLWMPPFFQSFILGLSQFVIITCTLVRNESTEMWPPVGHFSHSWLYFFSMINKKLVFLAKKACSVTRNWKRAWKRTKTFCSCCVTTILVKHSHQMQVWSFIESESNIISEEQLITVFYCSVHIL